MAAAAALLLLAVVPTQGAVPLGTRLRDYVHTAWTQHDGVALSSISTITQTTDGYLWIATREDLLRFDGVRFVAEPSPCGRPGSVVEALSDRGGGLWLLCDYSIFHRDARGRTVAVKQTLMPPELRPSMSMYVDRKGRLWFWGRSLGYIRPDLSEGPAIPGTERSRSATYCRITEDSEGDIWLGTVDGLFRIRDKGAERVSSSVVSALAASASGGVLALSGKSLIHVRNETAVKLMELPAGLEASAADVLQETGAGVWMSIRNHGLALFHDGQVETFGRQEGLSSDTVSSFFVDNEGTAWVGTTLGLHRFREPLSYLMSSSDGLPPGMPQFVFYDRSGTLWLGTSISTVRIAPNPGRRETIPAWFESIAEDNHGRIWLSSRNELGYLRDKKFVPVSVTAAGNAGRWSVRTDDQGRLWAISLTSGLYRIVDGQAKLEVPGSGFETDFLVSATTGIWIVTKGGGLLHIQSGNRTVAIPPIPNGSIDALYEIGNSLWVGSARGLSRWRNGQWTTWFTGEGLPGRGDVYEIIGDAQGRLWLMSDGGILVLDRAQLDQTPDGQARRLSYLRIGSFDRVVPHRGGIGSSPRIARDRAGKLYFATYDSVAVVDPSRLTEQRFMPPIVLETVLVNRKPVMPGAQPRFIMPEEMQFEYTSLSLRNPENVRFRYRLEGYDQAWLDAGTQRRATYPSLKPGSYRFRVIGSGSEGVWNETGASYAFQIASPFYQTPFFLFLAVTVVAALAYLMYRYRVALAAGRIRLRIEAQAGERLRIAQEMHDTFLQSVQSSGLMVHAAMDHMVSNPAEARRLLERTLQLVRSSTEEARRMLSSLRAVSVPGETLVARLTSMSTQEAAIFPRTPRVALQTHGAVRELQPVITEEVFLIASEALRNSLRHSQAKHVEIQLHFEPGQFRLWIIDDGVGMAGDIPENGVDGHFGLSGMRERAERVSGNLEIQSSPGRGTRVCLSIPGPQCYRS